MATVLFGDRSKGTMHQAWRHMRIDRLVSAPKFRSMRPSAQAPGCPDIEVHAHCLDGKANLLKVALDSGKDPNGATLLMMYSPPIHLAAVLGHDECVALLLEYGATISQDHPRRGGLFPTHLAALYDRDSVIRQLIDAGADVNACDRSGVPILNAAAAAGSTRTVKLLLACRDIDTLKRAAHSGETALHAACRHGHNHIVKLLIHFELERCGPNGLDVVIQRITAPLAVGSAYTRPSQVARTHGNTDCAASLELIVAECIKDIYSIDLRAATTSGYKSRLATSQLNETQYVPHKGGAPARNEEVSPRKMEGGSWLNDRKPRSRASYDPSMGGGMPYTKCTKCDPFAKDEHGRPRNITHSTAQHGAWVQMYKAAMKARRFERPCTVEASRWR